MILGGSRVFRYLVQTGQTEAADGLRSHGSAISLGEPLDYHGFASLHPDSLLRDEWMALQLVSSDSSRSGHLCSDSREPFVQTGVVRVGTAIISALQDGDILYFHHSATGDRGISLLRDEQLVVALGSVIGLPLGKGVSARNENRIQWLKFIRKVGSNPPGNSYVLISIQQTKLRLREGDEARVGSFYAYVERIFREGYPGEDSILGLACLSDRLTKQAVVKSVNSEIAIGVGARISGD
jgi:hypothetical protein